MTTPDEEMRATIRCGNVFADLRLPDADVLLLRTRACLPHDRIAVPVSELTDDEMALIAAATVPAEHDYQLDDIDDAS